MSLSKEVVIKWEWFSDYDNSQYEDFLEEEANKRIFEMMKEGCTSGELCAYLAEDAVEIRGWWSVTPVQSADKEVVVMLQDAIRRLESWIGADCECDNTHDAVGRKCCLCEYRDAIENSKVSGE